MASASHGLIDLSDDNLTFKLSESLQLESQISQLPAEIRSIILCSLLQLDPYDGRDICVVAAARARLRAGLSIVQTCQMWYREGSAVLFNENTAFVHLRYNDETKHAEIFCPVLKNAPWYLLILASELYPLVPDGDHANELLWKGFLRNFRKFRKCEFVVQSSPSILLGDEIYKELLFFAFQEFREALHEKLLTISFKELGAKTLLLTQPDLLDSCKILQRTTIKIKGLTIPQKLKQYLGSCRSVEDTYYEHWLLFMRTFVHALPKSTHNEDNIESFDYKYNDNLHDLRLLALRYDGPGYAAKQSEIVELAIKWKNDWWEIQLKKLVSGVETMRQGIEDYREKLGVTLVDDSQMQFRIDSLLEAGATREDMDRATSD